jgi:hypothetical protein
VPSDVENEEDKPVKRVPNAISAALSATGAGAQLSCYKHFAQASKEYYIPRAIYLLKVSIVGIIFQIQCMGPVGSESLMRDAILQAILHVNRRINETSWWPYLDVTEEFKAAINNNTSFEELLNEFADIDHRQHIYFKEENYVEHKIYAIGIHHPHLYQLNIKDNNFKLNYDIIVDVKYIYNNKYEFIKATVINRESYP